MFMILLVAFLLLPGPAQGQETELAGSYALQAPDGEKIVVELAHQGSGRYGGTLRKGSIEWHILGDMFEGVLVGTVTTPDGVLGFEAGVVRGRLELILATVGPDGMPDVDNAEQLTFSRVEDASRGTTSQSARPRAQRTPQNRSVPAVDHSPLAEEWRQHMAGKQVTYISSYSSGGLDGGGMSTRNVYHLCSDGSFRFSDQSTVTLQDPGSPDLGTPGSASQGGGTWRIVTRGQAAGIELRYPSGEAELYGLEYRDGATYADGTRIYVTPGEVCN